MRFILLKIIRIYQILFSFDHGIPGKLFPNTRVCRYLPSCSMYTYEAISKYGAIKGSYMGMKRIGRCHPWSRHEQYDPVT